MKIAIEYNEMWQTHNLWGPFIFVTDKEGRIRNLEAVW